jgi:hypothetical protein
MNREVHVRFWESAGLGCSAPLAYLHAYASVAAAKAGIGGWLSFYNEERLHQSHGYRTPRAVYEAQSAWTIGRTGLNRLHRSAGADRDRQLRPEISPPPRTPAPPTRGIHNDRWTTY